MNCCYVDELIINHLKQLTIRQEAIEQVVEKVVKRVQIHDPVEVRSFNSQDNIIISEYKNFGSILVQTCAKFGFSPSSVPHARFYWLPPADAASVSSSSSACTAGISLDQRLAQRKTIRNNSDWDKFIDEFEELHLSLITLYFVSGDVSPSLIQCPPPPSPPRIELQEEKSEPASSHGLTARDQGRCIVCDHHDHVEACHIIDKHRDELLSDDVPDAVPSIDDLRNLIQLCPNHHTSFDCYEWTLVAEYRQVTAGAGKVWGFWVRSTPVKPNPSPDISLRMQTFIQIADPCPPTYSFLLKQLGRFDVPCRICGELFNPRGIATHYNKKHSGQEDEWKDLPHLLPNPCPLLCDQRGTFNTYWELYCHIIQKHKHLLYC